MTKWSRVEHVIKDLDEPCEPGLNFECALCGRPCDHVIMMAMENLERKFIVGCHEDALNVTLSHTTIGLDPLSLVLFDGRKQPPGVAVSDSVRRPRPGRPEPDGDQLPGTG